jgi:hypothetical protein
MNFYASSVALLWTTAMRVGARHDVRPNGLAFAREAKPAARQRESSCRAAGLASQANSSTVRHHGAKDT